LGKANVSMMLDFSGRRKTFGVDRRRFGTKLQRRQKMVAVKTEDNSTKTNFNNLVCGQLFDKVVYPIVYHPLV